MRVYQPPAGPPPPPKEGGGQQAMSLRDYFATHAMAAIIIGNGADIAAMTHGAARDSYAVADAMMEARK